MTEQMNKIDNMQFDDFYNNKNQTERYLWDVCIISNYGQQLLDRISIFKYKRVFLGDFYNDKKKTIDTAFFLVIDTSKNNSVKNRLESLLLMLKRYKSLYIGNIVNCSSITILLKTGLSPEQLKFFMDSKYSKIYYNSFVKKHTILQTKQIKSYYTTQVLETTSDIDKKLIYNKTWHILTHSEEYFNLFITKQMNNMGDDVIALAKNKEYDTPIEPEHEIYGKNIINLINNI